MRKTLQDVAAYLKEIMVPETREKYAIKPVFSMVSDEEKIREGILAFRAFLVRLYDDLYITGNDYDRCKKVAHEYENRTTLSVYYPFLHNVCVLLMKMGYYGLLENANTLSFWGHDVFDKQLSVGKTLECLRFLSDCGIGMDGIDLNEKKQELAAVKRIRITYPDAPAMLTGLKVMAIAEIDHGTLVNQDVFLRCDYRVLKRDDPPVLSIVQDTIRALSPEVREFVEQLHQRYVDKGLACVVEVKGFHIYIRYCYKRKDVWGINASLNNGYHINVKSIKTEEYADTIKTFSPLLQELIAKGYGCGRKRAIGHCDGGCRGLPIPLDPSILGLRRDIETWFDQEVFYRQKK